MEKETKKILHISHIDADGLVPCAILKSMLNTDILRKDVSEKYELKTYFIKPSDLYTTLEDAFSEETYYVIITDLSITLDVLKFLSEHISIERTLICDHHQITYSRDDVYRIYSAEYDHEKIALIDKNIIIMSNYKNVQTCATTLFVSLGIYTLSELFKTDLIYSVVTTDEGTLDNIFTNTAKIYGYIRKLSYLSEITRLRDTFDFTNDIESKNSIDADHLYLSTLILPQSYFVDFIAKYLDDPWFIGYDLFQPEQEGTNCYVTKYSHLASKINELINERNSAIEYAMNTMTECNLNIYKQEVDKEQPTNIICAFIIKENYKFSSEIGYQILSKYEYIDMVAIYNISESSVQLRSRKSDNIDCAAIAREYSGNGHKTAAGFPVRDRLTFTNMLFKKLFGGTEDSICSILRTDFY